MENQIEILGLSSNYKVIGEGYPIVLMHGWGCEIKTFALLENHLSSSFKVYNIDFPGFGKSQEPPIPWGTADYEAWFKAFLNILQIENPILIGHSFGGRIAIRTAKDTSTKKMILIGSAGIKPTRTLKYYLKVYTFKIMKTFASLPGIYEWFGKDLIEEQRRKSGSSDYQQASEIMKGTLSKVVNEDLKCFMSDIKAPTLLIYGENDTATPIKDAKIMEKLIPDAGLVILKNAGHYVFLELAAQVHAIIDNFLDKEKNKFSL
jgi:pimeloyl-ACP methyl ester carboxylesterase